VPTTGLPLLYGLDIETDTSADGLDPGVAPIVAVALSCASEGEFVITGCEAGILATLDARLAAIAPGVLVTWNGGAFDLPFLASRAANAGVSLGLELAWDPAAYRLGRVPLAGHVGTYAAAWYGHQHLDAYRAWRTLTPDPEVPCGLKSVARAAGFEPVDVDSSRIHGLDLEDLRLYVASDASIARRLAQQRWSHLRRFIDRLPAGGQLALG
jgi:uncharacterized protein YprB with RNaseH-like and TPR domain